MSIHTKLDTLRTRIHRLGKDGRRKRDVRVFLNRLADWIQPAYKFEVEECAFATSERSGSFIYGWPWGDDEYSITLVDMPLCQLDLDEIRTVTGRDFGSGLLQFFLSESTDETDGYTTNDRTGPLIATSELIPRSAINRIGAPTPFLGKDRSPFDLWSEIMPGEDQMRDPDTGEDLIDLYKSNPEFDLIKLVDPKRAEQLLNKFNYKVSVQLANWGLVGDYHGFGPAKKIVNWIDVSDSTYSWLLGMTDKEIVDQVKTEISSSSDYMEYWMPSEFLDSGEYGLFFPPDMHFAEYWGKDLKPFFCFPGWDSLDMVNDWEIMYRVNKGGEGDAGPFEFCAFGERHYC